jgi:hypothetical protein
MVVVIAIIIQTIILILPIIFICRFIRIFVIFFFWSLIIILRFTKPLIIVIMIILSLWIWLEKFTFAIWDHNRLLYIRNLAIFYFIFIFLFFWIFFKLILIILRWDFFILRILAFRILLRIRCQIIQILRLYITIRNLFFHWNKNFTCFRVNFFGRTLRFFKPFLIFLF